MAIYRRRRAYGKKRVARKTATRKRAPKSTKAIARIVKTIIARNVENKLKTVGGSYLLKTSDQAGFQTSNIFPLTPYYESGLTIGQNIDISQGTGVSNRIGNRITTKSGHIRMVLYPRNFDAGNNSVPGPINATVWIFKLKSGLDDSTGMVQGIAQTNWFKVNNTTFPINNTITDNVLVPNDAMLTVLSRRIYKIGTSTQVTGSGGVGNNQFLANNDYKFNQIIKMNVSKYLRKRIKYQDNNLQPSTSTTWMCITLAKADGVAFLANQYPLKLEYEYDYRFEDA